MNKKGFTLIELLAVIVIIAIIAIISTPVILNYVDRARDDAFHASETTIAKAAENYAALNKDILPKVDSERVNVSLETLIDEGYLKPVKSPYSGALCEDDLSFVVITKDGESFTYQTQLTCGDKVSDLDLIAPVITLVGASNINVELNTVYSDAGANALDNKDGALMVNIDSTSINTNVLGNYTVIFSATDSKRNSSTLTRSVTVVENEAPVLSLTGNAIELTLGEAYVEPGYTATDNADGNITASVIITNPVNINLPGDYTISYSITDKAGNETIETRPVTVWSAWTVTNPGTGTIESETFQKQRTKSYKYYYVAGYTSWVDQGYKDIAKTYVSSYSGDEDAARDACDAKMPYYASTPSNPTALVKYTGVPPSCNTYETVEKWWAATARQYRRDEIRQYAPSYYTAPYSSYITRDNSQYTFSTYSAEISVASCASNTTFVDYDCRTLYRYK